MRRFFRRLKRSPDGRCMLNVGCGSITHHLWNNLDFGPYARLRRRRFIVACLRLLGILTDERRRRLEAVDPDIIAWDVRKGLPFPDDTFDVVYHSNLIEHLPRSFAGRFLLECRRILKEEGVLRMVTPDLEVLTKEYLESVRGFGSRLPEAEERHARAVGSLFEQIVRDQGEGERALSPLARSIERLTRGNAGARGERHLWAYDRVSLRVLLRDAGFARVLIVGPNESSIKSWSEFMLDVDNRGVPRQPRCIYAEAAKPRREQEPNRRSVSTGIRAFLGGVRP